MLDYDPCGYPYQSAGGFGTYRIYRRDFMLSNRFVQRSRKLGSHKTITVQTMADGCMDHDNGLDDGYDENDSGREMKSCDEDDDDDEFNKGSWAAAATNSERSFSCLAGIRQRRRRRRRDIYIA